jgi:hypothetical protein
MKDSVIIMFPILWLCQKLSGTIHMFLAIRSREGVARVKDPCIKIASAVQEIPCSLEFEGSAPSTQKTAIGLYSEQLLFCSYLHAVFRCLLLTLYLHFGPFISNMWKIL